MLSTAFGENESSRNQLWLHTPRCAINKIGKVLAPLNHMHWLFKHLLALTRFASDRKSMYFYFSGHFELIFQNSCSSFYNNWCQNGHYFINKICVVVIPFILEVLSICTLCSLLPVSVSDEDFITWASLEIPYLDCSRLKCHHHILVHLTMILDWKLSPAFVPSSPEADMVCNYWRSCSVRVVPSRLICHDLIFPLSCFGIIQRADSESDD